MRLGWIVAVGALVGGLMAKDQVEITAKHFSADEKSRSTLITGDVVITRAQDRLEADKVIIFFDEKNRPLKYEAEGGVKFELHLPEGRHIKGRSKRAIYDASASEYHLLGEALVEERGKSNVIKGEKVIINRLSGAAKIAGDKNRPARLVFTFEEKPKEKESGDDQRR